MKRIYAGIATLALAGGLAGGLAASASGSVAPTLPPTISITGVGISPGSQSTFYVVGTAKFSKAGTKVLDFPVLVDGIKVPEPYGPLYGGNANIIYGSWPFATSGGASNISPGRHVLTAEVIGVGGVVLATSPRVIVTVPTG